MNSLIAVSPIKVSLVLLLTALLLTGLNYVVTHTTLPALLPWFDVRPLFILDVESNIPTWFAAFLLLICAALLAVIGLVAKQTAAPYATHWLALSAIFLMLSLDETASLHEMLIEPIQQAYNLSGPLLFAWVVPGTLFVLLVGLAYLTFLANLPKTTRLQVLAAGSVYLIGVLGLESLGAWHTATYGYGGLTYLHLTSIEEAVEMLGLIGFIYALLSYIRANIHCIGFRVGSDSMAPASPSLPPTRTGADTELVGSARRGERDEPRCR